MPLGLHGKLLDFKEGNQNPTNADVFYHKLESIAPRVMNKLTLCFNPDKVIPAEASRYSAGLTNSLLADQAKFDSDSVSLLSAWLSRLPGPVCLVAHNGDKFDFLLLLMEIKRAGASISTENRIFSADTLVGIKNISSRGRIEQHEFSYSDVKKKRIGPPVNFRQPTLHKYLLGLEPSSSHSAEADCLSLMRITATLGSDWTDWVRNNASVIECVIGCGR